MTDLAYTALIGSGATAVMDAWAITRKFLFRTPAPNYGLVGRWLGHMTHGRFRHDAIAKATPIHHELLIGWVVHYLIGIAFAALLIAGWGMAWLEHPTLGPAMIIGVITVAAPFLLMQPGMGAGIAASRTARPAAARIQSLITHLFFGLGLYVSAALLHFGGLI